MVRPSDTEPEHTMDRTTWTLVAAAALAAGPAPALPQDASSTPDLSKRLVERPLKEALKETLERSAGSVPDPAPTPELVLLRGVDLQPDVSKFGVERPLKQALRDAQGSPLVERPGPLPFADAARLQDRLSKDVIELPLKVALRRSTGAGPVDLPPLENGVEPGKVAWHGSFEEALGAAAQSGKPVLLFQLLGRLDDEFC